MSFRVLGPVLPVPDAGIVFELRQDRGARGSCALVVSIDVVDVDEHPVAGTCAEYAAATTTT